MKQTLAMMGLGIGIAGAMGVLSMTMKSADYKARYGCETCKYESRIVLSAPCCRCLEQHGTKWKKVAPKPAYCECCGQEKWV